MGSRKLILFVHVSLDGFVAKPSGELDWIHVDEEIFDYSSKFIDESDTAVYGRVTYQMMENYWPNAASKPNPTKHDIEHSRWYNKVSKVVLSKTLKSKDSGNTKILSNNIPIEIIKFKRATGKNIIMLGSPTAAHFLMQNNLIDEFWLFVNPIILGEGIPLFIDIKNTIKLKLLTSKVFSSGVIGLHYERE